MLVEQRDKTSGVNADRGELTKKIGLTTKCNLYNKNSKECWCKQTSLMVYYIQSYMQYLHVDNLGWRWLEDVSWISTCSSQVI